MIWICTMRFSNDRSYLAASNAHYRALHGKEIPGSEKINRTPWGLQLYENIREVKEREQLLLIFPVVGNGEKPHVTGEVSGLAEFSFEPALAAES